MAGQQSNEQTIFNYFDQLLQKVYRFSPQQAAVDAAGIVGNAQEESGFDPGSYNQREGAANIFQWEGGRGPNGGLGQYAAAHHLSVTSLPAGLGYATQELQGPYSSTIDALRQATTPAQAAYAWAQNFEHNDPVTNPTRAQFAQNIYAQVQTGQPLTGGPSAPTSSAQAYLTGFTVPGGGIVNDITGTLTGGVIGNSPYGLGILGGGSGLGDVISAPIKALVSTFTAPFVRFFTDVGMVIFGAILLLLGIYLVANSRGDDTNVTVAGGAGAAEKKPAAEETAEAAAA